MSELRRSRPRGAGPCAAAAALVATGLGGAVLLPALGVALAVAMVVFVAFMAAARRRLVP